MNRDHPLVRALGASGDSVAAMVEALLVSLEASLPVEQIALRIGPPPTSTEPAPDEIVNAAALLLHAQAAQLGFDAALARVISSQPFDRFPDLARRQIGRAHV